MCKYKTCNRVISTIAILVALALAVTVSFWHQHQQGLASIIFVTRFFDVMLPVLGVGALLKYILCGSCGSHHQDQETCGKKD